MTLAAGLGAQSELRAAHSWARAAARLGDWATADGAFGIAIGAFERAEAYRPAGELRDVALPGSYGLPAAAALAKIRLSESLNDSGPLKDAIVILDRYRARQLIFSGIGTADPADSSVAAQIEGRRQRIEDELANVCSPINLPDQFDLLALSGLSKALALLADLADASAELAAIRAGQLAAVLADGDSLLELFGDRTIVYIASAPEIGFALIVGPTGTPIRTVFLPDLANDAVAAREKIYSAAPPHRRALAATSVPGCGTWRSNHSPTGSDDDQRSCGSCRPGYWAPFRCTPPDRPSGHRRATCWRRPQSTIFRPAGCSAPGRRHTRLLPGWRYSPHPLLPTTPRRC